MQMLPRLILISAGVVLLGFLPRAAHAVECQVQTKGGLGGGVTPALNCGPSGANGYIIPAADIPMCGATPCYSLAVLPNVVISLPAKATPAWGNTPAQVQQLLPYNILLNFEDNPNIDAAVASMGDLELARLSTELASNDVSDYTYSIMAFAGEKLSAANLRRLQAAVGPTVFATAIAYMSATTLAQYNATAVYAPIVLGVYWNSLNPTLAASVPSIGAAWEYDLLLNDMTASAGETDTLGAAHVSQYANARIKGTIQTLIKIGLGILTVLDSPTMQALGSELDQWMWVQNIMTNNTPQGGFAYAAVIIQIPNLGNITPPAINVPLPEMPAIEGDVPQNGASACTDPDNCPTSSS
jgi:hypothetical protein